jgi:hypothetical protein
MQQDGIGCNQNFALEMPGLTPYMGVAKAMRKIEFFVKLWITREKLWITASFWGKLAYLCEDKLVCLPPYMGVSPPWFPYDFLMSGIGKTMPSCPSPSPVSLGIDQLVSPLPLDILSSVPPSLRVKASHKPLSPQIHSPYEDYY